MAEKHAALEAEKKRKVQEVKEQMQQPRSLQIKRTRELEIREKSKRHKEVREFLRLHQHVHRHTVPTLYTYIEYSTLLYIVRLGYQGHIDTSACY